MSIIFLDEQREIDRFNSFMTVESISRLCTNNDRKIAEDILYCWDKFKSAIDFPTYLPIVMIYDWNDAYQPAHASEDRIICQFAWSFKHSILQIDVEGLGTKDFPIDDYDFHTRKYELFYRKRDIDEADGEYCFVEHLYNTKHDPFHWRLKELTEKEMAARTSK